MTAILKGCRYLEELEISNRWISQCHQSLTGDSPFAHLPPTLRSLNITAYNRFHPSTIDNLGSACAYGQLRELNISHLPIDSPAIAMGRLFETLPLLEKLVYYYGKLKEGDTMRAEEAVAAMAKIGAMKRLKSLELGSNPYITDEVGVPA